MSQETKEESKYAQLGVDAGKSSVRAAFGRHIDNEFSIAKF